MTAKTGGMQGDMDVAVTIALGGVLRSETPQPKIIMDDDFRPDSPDVLRLDFLIFFQIHTSTMHPHA